MNGHEISSDAEILENLDDYDAYIEQMREAEYPMLKDATYLDHAGTTPPSKSLLEKFHAKMITNLYGNPHSASPSSQHSTQAIDAARLELLRFFNADPEYFDLVFTANATAGIKLVGDALRDSREGLDYAYHVDSHTSLVGLRELAVEHRCIESAEDLIDWASDTHDCGRTGHHALLAYPLQSNMSGRRLPLTWWINTRRTNTSRTIYTLVDAAAYASTSSLGLSSINEAPDFTVVSLYKIFGFPDLGALIVKKSAGQVLRKRRYFGGGTVDMVVCLKEQWHAKKSAALHEQLEDGTLPVHNIVAVEVAIETHVQHFGTLEQVSKHTAALAKRLYNGLRLLKHGNGQEVCTTYNDSDSSYGDISTQGPIVAFNLRDGNGRWVSNTEVEKLASIQNIHIRTGGVCNPGGIATALNLAPWEMQENFSAGHRCGSENDIINGKSTGVVRISLGAMSTRSDVDRFVAFVEEFFVDKTAADSTCASPMVDVTTQRFHVESLTIYPIKSCGGWQISHSQSWVVRPEGLVWDREWCVVQMGTGKALSQKQYPRMALIRPHLDLKTGELRVQLKGTTDKITVSLSRNPNLYADHLRESDASVCGDSIQALVYSSPTIADFFTKALGVSCTLARFNPASSTSRHSKAHLQPSNDRTGLSMLPRPITMSNESPILTISRSSLNRLNELIKESGGKAALPSVFRANIVLAESPLLAPGEEQAWAEDRWRTLRIGSNSGVAGVILDVLGGCRRCQMVCVDQETAEKNFEPFVTLAKTRRFQGRVLFGVHTAIVEGNKTTTNIKAGDLVEISSTFD